MHIRLSASLTVSIAGIVRTWLLNFWADPQTTNKQEFSGVSGLPCAEPRYEDENHRRRLVISELSIPDICIQNWDNPRFKLPDTQKRSPRLLASTTPSDIPVVPAVMDLHATPLYSSLHAETSAFPNVSLKPSVMDTVGCSPQKEHVESHGCSQFNLTLDAERQASNAEPQIIQSVEEKFTVTFEPIKYAHSALSAISECNLWDVPSYDAARMVPLPLYTSTPPRPCSQLSTKQTDTCLSLLSYAELFDFSMYNSRISQDNLLVDFTFGDLPSDVVASLAPPPEVDLIPHFFEVNHQDLDRSPMNSQSTALYVCKSAETPVKSALASSRFPSHRKHLREISSNLIAFNSSLEKRTSSVSFTSNFRDSSFSMYSQSSASSLNLSRSLEY